MTTYYGYRPKQRQSECFPAEDAKQVARIFESLEKLGVASTVRLLDTGETRPSPSEKYLLASESGGEIKVSREEFLFHLRRLFTRRSEDRDTVRKPPQ